jgi:Protein of unknown function (DUF3185)
LFPAASEQPFQKARIRDVKDGFRVEEQNLKENSMNKLISTVILAAGIVFVVIGVAATESFSSDVSRFFTGSPTDKAIWMMIGGIVAIIIGLGGLLRGQPK